jgi:sugar O-acyltransferase (sialic acid O-acetyltransferase NeuD family)
MPTTSTLVPKPLVIYGAAGHAKVVFDIVERQGVYAILSVLDRYKPAGTECGRRRVSGTMEDLPGMLREWPDLEVIVAIGDNWARARISSEILQLCPYIRFGVAIHPSAQIGNGVSIGRGTVIMAGAVVNPAAQVGEGCILNTRASLDHDSVMGSYSSLGPGAAIGGAVHIGAYSSLGIGSAVIQEISIGEHVVVGAGAVVVRNIPDSVVAFGVPARVIHHRHAGERYLGDVATAERR